MDREFAAGPVVRTQRFHCWGLGTIACWESRLLQVAGAVRKASKNWQWTDWLSAGTLNLFKPDGRQKRQWWAFWEPGSRRDTHGGRSNDGHSFLLRLLDQLPREGLRDAFGYDGDGPDLEHEGQLSFHHVRRRGGNLSWTHLPDLSQE